MCHEFFSYCWGGHRDLHSFPTRRSSDLGLMFEMFRRDHFREDLLRERCAELLEQLDRKSTRLNSSHITISYAVFCLKKKRGTSHKYRVLHSKYCGSSCQIIASLSGLHTP